MNPPHAEASAGGDKSSGQLERHCECCKGDGETSKECLWWMSIVLRGINRVMAKRSNLTRTKG